MIRTLYRGIQKTLSEEQEKWEEGKVTVLLTHHLKQDVNSVQKITGWPPPTKNDYHFCI